MCACQRMWCWLGPAPRPWSTPRLHHAAGVPRCAPCMYLPLNPHSSMCTHALCLLLSCIGTLHTHVPVHASTALSLFLFLQADVLQSRAGALATDPVRSRLQHMATCLQEGQATLMRLQAGKDLLRKEFDTLSFHILDRAAEEVCVAGCD